MLSPNRLKSLLAFGAASYTYLNLVPITLMVGPTIPAVGMAATVLFGMFSLNENNSVSDIKLGDDGSLLITVNTSPFVSHTITTSAKNVRSIVALGADDLGADDTESNLVEVSSYVTAAGETVNEPLYLELPADAFRDKPMMDWILAVKGEDESTYDDFHDLMATTFKAKTAHGGLTGITAFEVRSTGLANYKNTSLVDINIEDDEAVMN